MISYEKLLIYLRLQKKFTMSVKPIYCVLSLPREKYHVTIYQDQWDDYQQKTGMPYHLFHISLNQERDRCSSYFWVDKKTYDIKNIPEKYFKYNQENYDYSRSTRSPCPPTRIKHILKIFGGLLKIMLLTENSLKKEFGSTGPTRPN